MATAYDNHSAEMRSALLQRRACRLQEREALAQAAVRIEEIDAELALIEVDLHQYGHIEPEPT